MSARVRTCAVVTNSKRYTGTHFCGCTLNTTHTLSLFPWSEKRVRRAEIISRDRSESLHRHRHIWTGCCRAQHSTYIRRAFRVCVCVCWVWVIVSKPGRRNCARHGTACVAQPQYTYLQTHVRVPHTSLFRVELSIHMCVCVWLLVRAFVRRRQTPCITQQVQASAHAAFFCQRCACVPCRSSCVLAFERGQCW